MNLKGKYLIIRHSTREPITDAKDSTRQDITEEGIKLAIQLGQKLAKISDDFSFYFSPIQRCKNTAICIQKGINQTINKSFHMESLEILGGFFYTDWDYCAKVMNTGMFTEKWFLQEISEDYIIPIKKTGTKMLNEILKHGKQNEIKIFITHDFNIFGLRSLFVESYSKEIIPTFLEGISIKKDKSEYRDFKQLDFV